MKGVIYRGIRLMPGSVSFELYQDKHLKELNRKWNEYLEAH